MKSISKILCILTILAFSFTILATGCGSPKSNADATTQSEQSKSTETEKATDATKQTATINVSVVAWQTDDGIDAATQKKTVGLNTLLTDTFYKQHPEIKLNVSAIPWENAKAKQQTLLMSNEVDVLYTAGAYATQFAQQGLLRYIDDLVEKDKSFDPGIYAEGLWDKSISTKTLDMKNRIGLPLRIGQRMIVYDKKIFDDWGVPYLSEHPTPDEILEKAKKLTGINPKTGKQNYGIWINGTDTNVTEFRAATYYFNAPICEGGLDDYANLNWKLNSPEMVKIMEWLAQLAQYAPPSFTTGKGNENFGKEENNIAINTSGNGTVVMSQYRATGKTDMIDRFIPVLHIGPNGECHVPCDPIVMNKNAKDVDAAWEAMKFLASYEVQKWGYENYNWTSALKSPDFMDPKDSYLKTSLEIASKSHVEQIDVNPFFQSDVIPFINNFLANSVKTKSTSDLKGKLDELNNKAIEWSKTYKK